MDAIDVAKRLQLHGDERGQIDDRVPRLGAYALGHLGRRVRVLGADALAGIDDVNAGAWVRIGAADERDWLTGQESQRELLKRSA